MALCCSLRIIRRDHAKARLNRVEFGDSIFDKPLVTDRIHRAECSILNSNTENNSFLGARPDELEQRHLPFPSNSIYLGTSGKDVEDLSFVDLPDGNMDI